MSSQSPIALEFDKSSVARIQSSMRRMALYLNKEMDEAIQAAAWYVARAASAATRKAPKTRKIVDNPGFKSSYIPGFWKGQASYPFAVLRYRKDRSTVIQPVPGKTRDEARENRKAKIGRRGLAKDAWSWIIGDLGKSMPALNTRRMSGLHAVTKNLGVANPSITLTDRLRYAMDAFNIRGRSTVNNIMQRAANSFSATIERKIAKKIAI